MGAGAGFMWRMMGSLSRVWLTLNNNDLDNRGNAGLWSVDNYVLYTIRKFLEQSWSCVGLYHP